MTGEKIVGKLVITSIIAILTLGLIGSYTVLAARPEKYGPPEVPGTAQRYNMTDVVPHAYVHNYSLGSMQALQFRNMTMMFNANRDMKLNITADPGFAMRHLEMNLRLSHSLSLEIHARVGPPEGVPRPEDGLHRYLEIEPNSTSGVRATMRLYIDHEELQEELGRYVEAQRLRWCFWNGTGWEPVTSWMDGEGFLVCNTSHFSSWTVREMKKPPTIPSPNIPGIPAHVRAYNYTMVTPEGFRWTMQEREQAVFAFRNMTMMFNCSRNLELNITAGPRVAQRLFSLEVHAGEAMRLNMRIHADPPTGIQATNRSMGTYFEIEPNATAPFNARLGMLIEKGALEAQLGREIDPLELRWAWWNGTAWEEVESTLTEDNVLEAETEHFSTWTIVETSLTEPVEPTPDEPEPQGSQTNWFLIGGVVVASVAALVVLLKKNR